MSLIDTLKATDKPLFGQQRAYTSGLIPDRWIEMGTDSDIFNVTGRSPSLYGFPLNTILNKKQDKKLNANIEHITLLSQKGVVTECDWHFLHPAAVKKAYNSDINNPLLGISGILPGGAYHAHFLGELDYLANFFNLLAEKEVELLFRPFHEMNGDWFWWGWKTPEQKGKEPKPPKTKNTPEQYKVLYNFTVEYLTGKGVDNLSYVWAPNIRGENTEEHYHLFYPGNVVNIIGLDMYVKNPLDRLPVLTFLNKFSQEKGKPLALTEFGFDINGNGEGEEMDVFFSNLAEFMGDFNFLYARTWAGEFLPYYGPPREDFINNFIPNVALVDLALSQT